MNTIQTQWEKFSSLVVPKDASPVQKQEMRRAFYAGAEAMSKILFAIGDQSLSEDAGAQILEGCQDEINRFALQVLEGKA